MGGGRSNTWFKGNKFNLTGTRIDSAIKSCVVSEHLHYCTVPMIRLKLSENVTFIVYNNTSMIVFVVHARQMHTYPKQPVI